MIYSVGAVERAMTIHQALLHALHGRQTWLQVADVIGLSPRSVRRWRARVLSSSGCTGLLDRRRRTRRLDGSAGRAPAGVAAYRERYRGSMCGTSTNWPRQDHGVTFSYTLVKTALQGRGAGANGPGPGPAPAAARAPPLFGGICPRWRPPSLAHPRPRRLAHPARRGRRCDEAAPLCPARGGRRIHPRDHASALAVFAQHGLPGALYTDRAHWAVHTPTSGSAPDRTRLTQVGRALHALGIEHILGHSPQARGRSERANRTLQDRLVNELRLAGIRTVPPPTAISPTAFSPPTTPRLGAPRRTRLGLCARDPGATRAHSLSRRTRIVARDNTVTLDRVGLQIAKQRGRRTCAGLPVLVRRHLDGRHSVWWGRRCLGRYDAAGRPLTLRPPPSRPDSMPDRSHHLSKPERSTHLSTTGRAP